LSLFEHSVSVAALHHITGIPENDLSEDLAYLQRLGLVDSSVAIRYRDARLQLYNKLAKATRRELHAKSFEYLQNSDCGKADLARHAHLGGLVEHGTRLYVELASTAYAARDFRSAANFYESAAECAGNDGAELTPEASVSLAKCYGFLGKPMLAKSVLGALIARDTVRGDAELSSAVYAAMSSPLVESSKQKCVDLLRRAVVGLPVSSPNFARRHRALAAALIVSGDIEEAEAVTRRAKELCSDDDKKLLDDISGFIQMNRGAFKEAERSFAAAEFRHATRAVALTNRAICFEQLGDLNGALSLHSEALECSKAEGLIIPEIANIASLAAVETKMGNMRAAQTHNVSALKLLEKIRLGSGTPNLLGNFFVDAALHWTHRGNYAEALRSLRPQVASNSTGASPLDFFFIRLAMCEVFLALGNFRKAASSLRSIQDSPKGEFFDNERLLIQSALRQPSEHLRTRLERAIHFSRQQGLKHQECRLSVELASILINLKQPEEARAYAKESLSLAQRFGYAPLAARLLLILGLTSRERSEKEACLVASVRDASRMDLMPIMASASYHLGTLHSDSGDFHAALEHLSRSVSLTLKMADGVPDRGRFLAQPDHQRALQLFQRVASTVRQEPPIMGRPIARETSLFSGLYRLTSSVIAAVTPEASLATLLSSLSQCLSGIPAIVADTGNVVVTTVPNTVVPEGMKGRASAVFKRPTTKPLFLAMGNGAHSGVAVWMPIPALSIRAGIYVEYPVEAADAIDEREIEFLSISAAVARIPLDYAVVPPLSKVKERALECPSIVGRSDQIHRIYAQIDMAARSSATVLIQGESGTGKELVAKAIHEKSGRSAGQFIAVDCGTLPDSLIEAELFGAKKGAYTGSNADHIGLFEAAHQGTLFLDEISNASPALQVKLLRALQQREIRRVGETAPRPVDLRLIAATNRDLLPLLYAGEFRQDLYFRLKVLHIQIPPLRERPSDIPLLAASFLNRLNSVHNLRRSFAPGLLQGMTTHYFPGNVRELQNIVERAFHASAGPVISTIEFDRVEGGRGQVDTWFRQLLDGETTFWSIRDRFRRRDISREQVTELVDRGLRFTNGSYRTLAASFRIKGSDYRRFMDFLRRNDCLLDFRTYRNSVVAFADEQSPQP
jgi:DNA-binding NtrC family response regulator/tetratricopeptide (TPR) repeat protein